MQMTHPKYYIPEFYIKHVLMSFLGLMVFSQVAKIVIEYTFATYAYIGIGLAVLLLMFGMTGIGYFNASRESRYQRVHATYLHLFFVAVICVTDLAFGDANPFITLLRNIGIFVFLQVGAYTYRKKNSGYIA